MSEDVVLAAIRLDTVSVAASSVFAEYPEYYLDANKVPRHITTCLADLTSGYGSFNTITSISRGDGKNTTAGIIIEPSKALESIAAGYEDMMLNAEPGATKALVRIIVKGVRTSLDAALTRDIGLRLMYILDDSLRSVEGNTYMAQRTYQDMDTSADNTILNPLTSASGYFKMTWVRSDELSVGEWGLSFYVEFIRNFG